MNSIKVLFNGLELNLLADRAIWAPSLGCLFVADTHFGKTTTFRQMGLAVPAGTTASMLERLNRLLSNTAAEHLVVLGDWIHHSKSAGQDYIDELTVWRDRWRQLLITCVEGNHDHCNRRLLSQLSMELVVEGTELDQLLLCHYPIDETSADKTAAASPTERPQFDQKQFRLNAPRGRRLRLCGHLHPGRKLPIAPKLLRSFPCFVVGNSQIILPAFGEFKGLAQVDSSASLQLIACVNDQLFVVPEALEQIS
ncbi:MAG: metallophosphoesterase family protein [Pirellulales bacterium]